MMLSSPTLSQEIFQQLSDRVSFPNDFTVFVHRNAGDGGK